MPYERFASEFNLRDALDDFEERLLLFTKSPFDKLPFKYGQIAFEKALIFVDVGPVH